MARVILTLEDDGDDLRCLVEFQRTPTPPGRLMRSRALRLWDELEPRLRNMCVVLFGQAPTLTPSTTTKRRPSKSRAARGRTSKSTTKT